MLRRLLNSVAGLFTVGPPVQYGSGKSTIAALGLQVVPDPQAPARTGWALSQDSDGRFLVWHDGQVIGFHPVTTGKEALAYAHSLAAGQPVHVTVRAGTFLGLSADADGVLRYTSPGRPHPRYTGQPVETFSDQQLRQPEAYVAKEGAAFNANDAAVAGIAGSVEQELPAMPAMPGVAFRYEAFKAPDGRGRVVDRHEGKFYGQVRYADVSSAKRAARKLNAAAKA